MLLYDLQHRFIVGFKASAAGHLIGGQEPEYFLIGCIVGDVQQSYVA